MNKCYHGGGYKKSALIENINWSEVMDFSTTINWKATEYYPDKNIYLHYENSEYPDSSYQKLNDLIETNYNLSTKHLYLTNGANEAISILFNLFEIQEYNHQKSITMVGSVYSEYHKYAWLHKFSINQIKFDELSNQKQNLNETIFIMVNPNSPFGFYYDLNEDIVNLLNNGAIVVIDESFIDFTDKDSVCKFIHKYPNLFIIHSLTKFYGSPGARLGLLINSDASNNKYFANLIPQWNISAYDNWFYKIMIPNYKLIKKDTLEWISFVNKCFKDSIHKSDHLKLYDGSITHFHTLELTSLVDNLVDIFKAQKYLLKKYKIFIRPTKDFYNCPNNSFRIGLRLPDENEALLQAIKEIR